MARLHDALHLFALGQPHFYHKPEYLTLTLVPDGDEARTLAYDAIGNIDKAVADLENDDFSYGGADDVGYDPDVSQQVSDRSIFEDVDK